MKPRKSTAIELVEILKKCERTPGTLRIIRRAEVGHYHDLLTEVAAPKMELISDLRQEGLENLANAVMRGEYDEDPDDRRIPTVEN